VKELAAPEVEYESVTSTVEETVVGETNKAKERQQEEAVKSEDVIESSETSVVSEELKEETSLTTEEPKDETSVATEEPK
jgi:hypothetical protein